MAVNETYDDNAESYQGEVFTPVIPFPELDSVDIFQDGLWKKFPVVYRVGDYVTYIDLSSHQLVTVLSASLPYKDEGKAQVVRAELAQENNS